MAAGRFDVTRRRDVHHSNKETYHYRSRNHDLDSSRGLDQSTRRRNGYGSYSGDIRTDDGRDGGGKGRGFVSSRTNDGFSAASSAGNNEISKIEDGELVSSEKKRKFSPIVWDRDGKQVRISSKNRLVRKITPICSPPSSPESFRNLTNVAADGDVTAASQLPNVQSSPVGKLEEENIEFRHISTSRWAFEEDSPMEICLDNSDDVSITRRVEHHVDLSNSPESGEFRREGFDGSRGNSAASDGRHSLKGTASRDGCTEDELENDVMEIDEKRDEVAGVSFVDWDVEDDEDSSRLKEPTSPKQRSVNMLQGCRSVLEYDVIGRINEGTYGVVYKAWDKNTKRFVALKKVKMGVERESDGFPLLALREINILLSLHHPSVVAVKEVVVDKEDGVFMVMEYMEHDLKELIKVMKQPFSEKEVKCLMRQLLEGVNYLHDNWILHRDLKTSNLLLNNSGKLKICDFGLSRQYGSPLKPYTPLVVTLWYRAPELLLGTKQYSTAIDMWSVGCIMAELLAKEPLFNGKTEIEQLDKIFKILGTPSETIWPGFSNLPRAKVKFVKHARNTLREKFPPISFKGSPVLSEQGFDLLSQLLTYDPKKRISAEAALKHSWFHVESEQDEVSIQESLARRLKLIRG